MEVVGTEAAGRSVQGHSSGLIGTVRAQPAVHSSALHMASGWSLVKVGSA